MCVDGQYQRYFSNEPFHKQVRISCLSWEFRLFYADHSKTKGWFGCFFKSSKKTLIFVSIVFKNFILSENHISHLHPFLALRQALKWVLRVQMKPEFNYSHWRKSCWLHWSHYFTHFTCENLSESGAELMTKMYCLTSYCYKNKSQSHS